MASQTVLVRSTCRPWAPRAQPDPPGGLGKAPGPDGLPAEFYKAFKDLIVLDMLRMFDAANRDGAYHKTVRSGHIIVLYKKGSPQEVRNYRPITLLNVDYKILTKVLGERIKVTLDSIISAPQTGFVPKRQIAENTHLMRLIQG